MNRGTTKIVKTMIIMISITERPPWQKQRPPTKTSSCFTRNDDKFGERGFHYSGPAAWSTLPSDLHDITDTNVFKKRLKTVLFDRAYWLIIVVVRRSWTVRRAAPYKSLIVFVFVFVFVISLFVVRSCQAAPFSQVLSLSVRTDMSLMTAVNNNNNNNNPKTMFMVYCHHGRAIARVHLVHLINVEQRPSGCWPKTKPDDLGCVTVWVCQYRLPTESTLTIAIY